MGLLGRQSQVDTLSVLQQVRDLLKVEWVQGDPARGLDNVYLSDDDYQRVKASVKAELRVQPDGECRGSCEEGSWCPWSFRQLNASLATLDHTGPVCDVPLGELVWSVLTLVFVWTCRHPCACTGERHWIVSDIIGAEDGLGVENLSGSAAIGTLFCK